jgi:GAF domain-containing protein
VFKDGKFWGVFDLDSPEYNTFDDVDANYLSEIAPIVFGVQAEVGGSILNDRRYQ